MSDAIREVGQARFERWPTVCDVALGVVGRHPKRLAPPYDGEITAPSESGEPS